MKNIPYGKQYIDSSDIKEVVNVLRSDWITQGSKVAEFEERLARYCGARYAVCVSSGTAALHIACLAGGIEKGDEVITSPITFVASANCILYCGAKPVFADIQADTANIDPEEIKKKITSKTKAIIPVHFAGLPCDMKRIFDIAKKNNLIVIEDACHALGAEYRIRDKWAKVGNCGYSDMSVFSFHPVKHITTGEGGAITTNNRRLYEKLKALRSHGIYKDARTKKQGSWFYEMRDLGFNYRITDFQCALGLSQLRKISQFIRKRISIAGNYNGAFEDIQDYITLPTYSNSNKTHAWHLYLVHLQLDRLKCSRKKIFSELRQKKIGVQVHYIPVYRQPFYRKRNYSKKGFSHAEKYYRDCISLPIYVDLDSKSQEYTISSVRKIIIKYSKKRY